MKEYKVSKKELHKAQACEVGLINITTSIILSKSEGIMLCNRLRQETNSECNILTITE